MRAPPRAHDQSDRFLELISRCGAHARPKKVTNFCGCVLHASVVATVVRTPRSEVSQRHRAGSWVWVVSKSRLDNFVELELPPHEVGVLPRVA